VSKFHRLHSGAPRQISSTAFASIPFSRADLATNWRSSRRVVVP
jgi:hypothetical protein